MMYRGIIALGSVLAVLLVSFTAYVVMALFGRIHITLPIFFGMLIVLTVANAWLLLVVWRARKQLSPIFNVAWIIWGGVSIWYWTFAPLYYVLTISLNAQQLAWLAFAFLWEVPIIGGGILTTLGTLLFRPIVQAEAEGRLQKQPLVAYRRVVKYPARIGWLLFFVSIFGYIIGAWQVRAFAGMSLFEFTKSIINGPIIAVFLAVFFYITLDTYIDDYRRRLSRWVLDRSSQVRSLRKRLAIVNVAMVFGGVGLLALLVVQSWQGLQEDRIFAEMRTSLDAMKSVDVHSQEALETFIHGSRGEIRLVSQAALDELPISKETRGALHTNEGVVRDLYKQGKILAFVTRGNDDRLINIAYMTDFYEFDRPDGLVRFGVGIFFVAGLTIALFLYVSYEITRSLISLRSFAEKPSVAQWGKLTNVHTGDEIESVGRTFLQYVQKAEEADKTKREFISIASHQLRTPLTSIQWYIELVLADRDKTLTDEQRSDLERISRNNKRMVQLVNELLNVSRIDSGRLTIRPEKVDIVKFVEELVTEVLPQANSAKCALTIEKDISEEFIWIDQLLLRQVIHNLLTNSIKYHNPKRECSIVVRLSKDDTTGDSVITVSDTGIGIPKSEQHRVFDKFWRAENVLTLNTEGTGLGLYVGKMLLEAAGGKISFTSQEQVGTTFQVTIPSKGMQAKPGDVGLTNIDVL